MPAAGDRDLELGADAVGRRDQDGIREARCLQIEKGAEAADVVDDAEPPGRPRERLDRLDQPFALVDIDARVPVAQTADGFPPNVVVITWRSMGEVTGSIMDRGDFAIIVCWRAWTLRAIATLALMAVAVVACTASAAADDDLFEVLDIKVDETDQTAAAAREKALAEGERRAWDVLVQRLADPQQRRLPQFSQREIGDAVKDIWVTEEKTSPVRYIASLNYNFRPASVRRLLTSRGVRFTMTPSQPVVVLPVYEAAEGRLLWDDPNPWRQAWQSVRVRGLVPIKVPNGDLADLSIVGVDQALAGDRSRLVELAQRHGAGDALVTVATVEPGPASTSRNLKVSAIRYSATSAQPLAERSFAIEAGAVTPDLLRQAALTVADDLQAAWRHGTATAPAESKPTSATMVAVPLPSLEEWVRMRTRLQTLPQVQSVTLQSITREEARLMIVYPGKTEELSSALAERGLYLRDRDGGWVITTDASISDQASGAAAR
jgi:hypothetical protein